MDGKREISLFEKTTFLLGILFGNLQDRDIHIWIGYG
jgi:hypothetical protein